MEESMVTAFLIIKTMSTKYLLYMYLAITEKTKTVTDKKLLTSWRGSVCMFTLLDPVEPDRAWDLAICLLDTMSTSWPNTLKLLAVSLPCRVLKQKENSTAHVTRPRKFHLSYRPGKVLFDAGGVEGLISVMHFLIFTMILFVK